MAIALWTVFAGLMVFAALYDAARMIIPNWVSIALACLFPLAALASGVGLETALWHAGLGFGAFALAVAAFAVGLMGGGDAKLMPAALFWLGPDAALPFLYWTAIAGGGVALVTLTARLAVRPVAEDAVGFRRPALFFAPKGVAYGPAIAIGALLAAPSSPLF